MTEPISDATLLQYRSVIAPFLMMTSCATLVWSLQTRFSRIVQAIRSLVSEGKRDGIDFSHSLAKQIAWLKARSHLLRNSIVCLYFAMCSFLLSAILLALGIVLKLGTSLLIVALFLAGLLLICVSLVATLVEIAKSHSSLAEEVANR